MAAAGQEALSGCRLRRGTVADIAAAVAVEAAALTLLQGHPAHVVFAASPTPRTVFEAAASVRRWWVAEVAGRVVGHAAWTVLEGDAHLLQMDVDPAHGRRGIGRALLARTCEDAAAAGHRTMLLTTLADVPWNAPFYASAGFGVVPRADWSPAQQALMAAEAAAGFPMHLRVLMRKSLTRPGAP